MARTNPDSIYRKIILFILFLVAIPSLATLYGHGRVAWAAFTILVMMLYAIAPARRWATAEKICESVDLKGKVAIVTGPTSGIGIETARVLAKHGAHVVMMARSLKKLEATKADLEATLSAGKDNLLKPQLTCITCDLEDLDSVRSAAQSFIKLGLPLHLLICNAGIMALPQREESKQGFEKQVGVCHIGHFLLFKLLQPCLEKAAQSRVVCLSSSAYRMHDGAVYLKEPKLDTIPYDAWAAYGNAKASNLLFAKELHHRLSSKGISAYSLNPGGIHTGLQGNVSWTTCIAWRILTPFVFKSIPQGAATTILCATSDAVQGDGGKFFDNLKATDIADKVAKEISEGLGEDAQKRLWDVTESLLASRGYL